MRAKNVINAVVTDLGTVTPFCVNYTVVAINMSAAANTLQFSDSPTGPFVTAAVIPALASVQVDIAGRYAAIEDGAGNIVLLGN